VNFEGTISSVSGGCPNVSLTVSGTTIVVDGSTSFSKNASCTDLRRGRDLSGSGTTQPNGSIKATNIRVNKDDDDDDN
jgi:hypothetical protein